MDFVEEVLRFLTARMQIEDAALRCVVPAFLLNPLVENALKHGDAGATDAPLVLRVEARLVESSFHRALRIS